MYIKNNTYITSFLKPVNAEENSNKKTNKIVQCFLYGNVFLTYFLRARKFLIFISGT